MTTHAPTSALSGFERDVVLMTGQVVGVRPARPADVDGLRHFYDQLSDRSTYLRFFGMRPEMADESLVPPEGFDPSSRVALLALAGDQIIGIGEYWASPGQDDAEVAFAVADRHQHEGVATLLLEDLAQVASAAGLRRLTAVALASNQAMIQVFRTVGLAQRIWFEEGEAHVELDLTGENLLEAQAASREWHAAVASLRAVLDPELVVVIGAGRRAGSPGRVVLANLLDGFGGRVSVVHRSEREIAGVPAVPSVADLDPVPDLAVVSVPAADVLSVVDECGRHGVRAVVVISAGFAEAAVSGVEAERALLDTVRQHGMRLVGPNCLGVVSTAHGLNATFMRQHLVAGPVAVASQSGGIGIVIAAEAARRQLGISSFVSLGNKLDVSGNDLLRYWADDAATGSVLLYLESVGDPLRFARIARAVSRQLPVVVLKSGRSTAGERGARSHTAALATDDAAIDALFAHTGVIRADTLDELLDVGVMLAKLPAPTGRRVALVGNAGGPLVLAADAAEANGLDVVALSDELQRRIRARVPDAASTDNPVDLLATVDEASTAAVVAEIASSGEVDACAVVHVDLAEEADPGSSFDADGFAVPVIAAHLARTEGLGALPTYPTPERAMRTLALSAARGAWLSSAHDEELSTDTVDLVRTRATLRNLAEQVDGPTWLGAHETFGVLDELDIPAVGWAIGESGAECARHAAALGFPCVLKADVSGLVHKSEAGAVALDLRSPTAVRRAVARFRERFGDDLRRVLVQHQAEPGIEVLVGAVRDPGVGPLVVVAAGGTNVEVLADRTVSLAPLTWSEASAAIERLRMYPLFAGHRGRRVVPVAALVDVVRRIGLLVAAVPEIVELDLNPVIASPDRTLVVDARISVAPNPVLPLRAMRAARRTPAN